MTLNALGINLAHAYSVLDTVELRDSENTEIVTDRLVYIRNPWGEDNFNGTFSKS